METTWERLESDWAWRIDKNEALHIPVLARVGFGELRQLSSDLIGYNTARGPTSNGIRPNGLTSHDLFKVEFRHTDNAAGVACRILHEGAVEAVDSKILGINGRN